MLVCSLENYLVTARALLWKLPILVRRCFKWASTEIRKWKHRVKNSGMLLLKDLGRKFQLVCSFKIIDRVKGWNQFTDLWVNRSVITLLRWCLRTAPKKCRKRLIHPATTALRLIMNRWSEWPADCSDDLSHRFLHGIIGQSKDEQMHWCTKILFALTKG